MYLEDPTLHYYLSSLKYIIYNNQNIDDAFNYIIVCYYQESYGQDSDKNANIADDIDESIVISDEDGSPTIDDTITNFIDKAADQYFDDNKGEKVSVYYCVLHPDIFRNIDLDTNFSGSFFNIESIE